MPHFPTTPEQLPLVSAALMRLPEEQRLICCLFYLERISLDEIGMLLDLPEWRVAELFYLAHAAVAAEVDQALAPVAA